MQPLVVNDRKTLEDTSRSMLLPSGVFKRLHTDMHMYVLLLLDILILKAENDFCSPYQLRCCNNIIKKARRK